MTYLLDGHVLTPRHLFDSAGEVVLEQTAPDIFDVKSFEGLTNAPEVIWAAVPG